MGAWLSEHGLEIAAVVGAVIVALLFALGMAKQRREIERAKKSRWATWLDEPRDPDKLFRSKGASEWDD